jgi:hypothetical protein
VAKSTVKPSIEKLNIARQNIERQSIAQLSTEPNIEQTTTISSDTTITIGMNENV